jgi:hypothetical protein
MEALFQKRFLRHFRIDFPIKYFSLLLKLPQSFDIKYYSNFLLIFMQDSGRGPVSDFRAMPYDDLNTPFGPIDSD